MTERVHALEAFEALIGTCATEATHPMVDAVVLGRVTFEWLEGGRFLIQRSHNAMSCSPTRSASSALPRPATAWSRNPSARAACGGHTASRSTTACALLERRTGFDQRFSATLGHDSFEGLWQLAKTPGDWRDDL